MGKLCCPPLSSFRLRRPKQVTGTTRVNYVQVCGFGRFDVEMAALILLWGIGVDRVRFCL